MMKAIVQRAYGSAPEDVLRYAEVPKPVTGDDKVLVRVRAASVDRGTVHLMTGLPYLIRLLGFGLRAPKQPNPGRSLAGTVESVGKDVTAVQPGDEVYGSCDGSFAEYVSAPGDLVAPRPANISFEEAATVPISAVAALQAVRDRGEVHAGQHVLIIGAAGGVGGFALQIAKAFGAEVTGVCSTAQAESVRAMGADHIVDYTREDFVTEPTRYDVILDTAGHRRLSHLRRALTPRGTLVLVGSETDGRLIGGFDRQLRAPLLSLLVSQKLRMLTSKENADDLSVLRGLIESGKVTPVLGRTYPLSEAAAAIRQLTDGHTVGKVVLTV
jgi:NADPH:quinone reductase-like Zn-dependent oxidoreductase